MELFVIRQTKNTNYGAIRAAVVAAADSAAARTMHPLSGEQISDWTEVWSEWCKSPDDVEVTPIGVAHQQIDAGVLLSEFANNE